jgi:hypothetical protein
MRNKLTITGISILAALTLACGAGESAVSGDGIGAPAGADNAEPDAADKQILTKKVGETLTVSNDATAVEYTLNKVEEKTSDQFGTKPEKGVYLLAYLTVKVTKGSAFVCSAELSFVSSDGKVSNESFGTFKNRPGFESAEVAAGQKTDGWVVFEVPKAEAKKGKIQLQVTNLLSDNEYGYWTL